MKKWTLIFAALVGVAMATGANAADSSAAPNLSPEQVQFFEKKVRPLLANNCYKCHSDQATKVKGGLLLDTREGCLHGGDTGPAVVPGDVKKSLLIKAISYTDPDLKMPPKGEKLSDTDIYTFVQWIKMGAPDPRTGGTPKLTGLNDKARSHWSYQPIKEPPVPTVSAANKRWVKTEVDAFVISNLEQHGMHLQDPVSKEALIRRATFDLIGLPPTVHEVREFLIDDSPKAFERVVDRLLASPHYGERWGRYWLDSARYADTTGDLDRNKDYDYAYAWTYRDWVVSAFNEDMPYDRFLMEQLAADQMDGAADHPRDLAALGFLTVGRRFRNPNDTIDERIDTISKSMLGMTVACARCHDHKFDPIPTADYYSLHGILSSITEPKELPVIYKSTDPRLAADYQRKVTELQQKNRDAYFQIVTDKSNEFRKKAGDYLLGVIYSRHETAENAKKKEALIAKSKLDNDLLRSLDLGDKKSLMSPLVWFDEIPSGQWEAQVPKVFERIKQQAHQGKINEQVADAFAHSDPDSFHDINDVIKVYAKIFGDLQIEAKGFLDANRQATTADADMSGFPRAIQELLQYPVPIEPSYRLTTDHLKEITGRLALGNNPNRMFYFGALADLEMTNNGGEGKAMVVVDRDPHNDPIFIKGDQNHRGDIAPRRFLQILSPPDRKPFTTGSGRLELAQCIASRSNPMTARVMINRIWMHHFGDAFVPTPDDLGVQSEPPTNQALLDYLSARFMREGWSIKKIHRLIMLSSVYQQSSDTNSMMAAKDPQNKLLWRQNLRRLDFEAIRDSMLMFTGRLDETMGGRPVNLTDEPYSNRRSIYGFIDRGRVPELLSQFDFADPNRANSRRTSTIVPQQALFFMNSSMSADVARKLVSRPDFLRATTDVGRVEVLYMQLFSRETRPAEVSLAAAFFNAHDPHKVRLFSSPNHDPSEAKSSDDDSQMKPGDDRRGLHNEGEMVEKKELSLWEQYAQALLFTNEIVYVN